MATARTGIDEVTSDPQSESWQHDSHTSKTNRQVEALGLTHAVNRGESDFLFATNSAKIIVGKSRGDLRTLV